MSRELCGFTFSPMDLFVLFHLLMVRAARNIQGRAIQSHKNIHGIYIRSSLRNEHVFNLTDTYGAS